MGRGSRRALQQFDRCRGSRSTASTSPPVTDRAKVIDEDRRTREVAPFMSYGEFTGHAPLGTCAFWPVPPTSKPHEISAKGLPPTLVVSTTNDPATPYQAGVDLAKQLGGSLLTFDGHPAHRCVPGQPVRRRHRRQVPDRRHRAAAGRELLSTRRSSRTVTVRLRGSSQRRSMAACDHDCHVAGGAECARAAGMRAGRQAVACPAAWAAPEDQSTAEPTASRRVWGGCEQFLGDTSDIPTAQCGTVSVPVDYANPGRRASATGGDPDTSDR